MTSDERLDPDEHLRRRDALIALTADPRLLADDLAVPLRRITEAAAAMLRVERASVWRYAEDRGSIRCEDLYETGRRAHSQGAVLRATDYPSYFRALGEQDVITAHDARQDPRTREFTGGYLVPMGIGAMLDAAVRVEGRVIGVVCHEALGPPRPWTAEEGMLAVALAGLVSMAIERWERRQAEQSLQSVVEAAANAFVLADERGIIRLVNRQAETLFGRPRDSMVGQPLEILVPDRFRAGHCAHYADFMAASRRRAFGADLDLVGLRANGTEVPVEIGLDLIERGGHRFVLASLVDVTERRRVRRMRSSIGLALSHELNTPLNGILGSLQLLGDDLATASAEDLRQSIEDVRTSAVRLHTLVRRNLDFAALEVLESGSPAPQSAPQDTDALVRGVAVGLAEHHGRAADLVLDLRAGTSLGVERWLERLVTELLDNAFKFSARGSTVLVATRAAPELHLVVEDHGRGMTSSEIEAAGAFIQFDRGRYEQQGVGLGLHLARRIADLHGGGLVVTSRPGLGTRVAVRLGTAT